MLKIHNWEKWQSYRADRGQPPWIKLHRQVLRDPNFIRLSDAERGQLTAIWILAADRNGHIPEDPAVIKKLCFMDSEPNIKYFQDLGWIDGGRRRGVNAASSRRQGDVNVTAQSRVEESREEERRGEEIPPAARRPTNSNHQAVESIREVLEGFKQLPSFAHMDVQREIDKIELWRGKPKNRKRVINRAFLANWVSKIDPPLPGDPGKAKNLTAPCEVPGCRFSWITKNEGLKVCVDHATWTYRKDRGLIAEPATDPVQQSPPPGGAQAMIAQVAGSFGKMK